MKKRPKPKAKFLQKNIRSIFKIHKIMKSVVKLEEKGRRNSGGDRPYKRLKFRTYKKKRKEACDAKLDLCVRIRFYHVTTRAGDPIR